MRLTIRCLGLSVLIVLLWRAGRAPAEAPRGNWRAVADGARRVALRLLQDYPFLVDAAHRDALQKAVREIGQGSGQQMAVLSLRRMMDAAEARRSLEESDAQFEKGARALAETFAHWPGLFEIPGKAGAPVAHEISIPHHAGIVILHRGRSGAAPRFLWKTVRVHGPGREVVKLGEPGPVFCILEVLDPPGAGQLSVSIDDSAGPVVDLALFLKTPARLPVTVNLIDDAGKPVDAAIGIYSPRGELLVPDAAVEFGGRGYFYEDTRYRDHANARYWPLGTGYTRCFFARGRWRIDLPAGAYRLIASKGPEYASVDRSFTVGIGRDNNIPVKLHRWIDMSRRGWHLGDCHIHFARPDAAANEALRLWTQAEDLRMSNVLRMGDGRGTYFEQYAFGKRGRFAGPGGAIVPGQEDPRTHVLGHTISLNIQKPIHDEQNYYDYGSVFDAMHAQGAVVGYAHVYGDLFSVRRDMSLNVPREKVDFAEIADLGAIKPDLYYEFLNLGFRLPAAGGSDAPWGGSAGDVRTYVYTGKPFDADEWLAGLRAGRTFVTQGPILEFTVDGERPGAELERKTGDQLRIHARVEAGYGAAPTEPLQVVANGEVIRESSRGAATLDFEIPAGSGMWIAARTKSAHTSPVYVTVDGRRHWKLADVPRLIDERRRDLDEIEKLVATGGEAIQPGPVPDRENPPAFARSAAELRRAIEEARAVYDKLAEAAGRP